MTVPIRYVMRGTKSAPPYDTVTWSVWDSPDLTGEFSGFTDLTNIVVDYQVQDNVSSGGNTGNTPQPIVPTPEDPLVYRVKYVMKGTKTTIPYDVVTWSVWDTADFTGTYSGYAGNIDNIVVDYQVSNDIISGGNTGSTAPPAIPEPPIEPESKIRYVMKANINISPYELVTWSVWDTPDYDATFSGYPTGTLENIFVDYQISNDVTSGGNTGNSPTPIIPEPPDPVNPKLGYVMKGMKTTAPYDLVTWKVWNLPDWTGVDSGYFGNIENIVIDYSVVDEVNRGPQALPTYTVITGPAGGDLDGQYPNPSVVAIQGSAISETAPTTGQILEFDGAEWVAVSGVVFSDNTTPITGQILEFNGVNWSPIDNAAVGPAGGDLSGTYPNPLVGSLKGVTLSTTVPTTGQVLSYDGSQWIATSHAGIFTAGGDLTGNSTNQIVSKIRGATTPSTSGAAVGNVLKVLSGSALVYGAINLAGGVNHVTGLLPAANQAGQTMGGDVTGSASAATVFRIRGKTLAAALSTIGAAQDGYALTWVNGSIDWEAKPLAGDVTGPITSSTVTKLRGKLLATALASVGATQDGYVITWNNGASEWRATPTSAVITFGGDLSGTSGSQTIEKIKGKTLASVLSTMGATQDGYDLQWVNSASEWQAKPNASQTGIALSGSVQGYTYNNLVHHLSTSTIGNAAGLSSGLSVVSPLQGNSFGSTGIGSSYTGLRLVSTTYTYTSNADANVSATLYSVYPVIQLVSTIPLTATRRFILAGGGTIGASIYLIYNNTTGGQIITVTDTVGGSGVNIQNGERRFVYSDEAGSLFAGITTDASITGLAAGGDLSGTYPDPTVAEINGSSVPAGGSLTAGNVLKVLSGSALTYGAVNLAGGSGHVSGLLPTANQTSQTLGGDASGTTAAVVNTQARGLKSATTTVSVSAATAPSSGQVLTATGSTTATWQAAAGGAPTGLAGGDLGGSYPDPTVVSITGSGGVTNIASTGDTFTWDSSSGPTFTQTSKTGSAHPMQFIAQSSTLSGSGGDLSFFSGQGSSSSDGEIEFFIGNTLKAQIDSDGIFTFYDDVKFFPFIGGGAGIAHINGFGIVSNSTIVNADVSASAAIAGTKISPNFGAQSLVANDIRASGLTAGIVRSDFSGNFTSAPIDLASGSTYIIGILPTANQTSQTMLGDVTGTTSTSTVVKLYNKSLDTTMSTVGAAQDGYAVTWNNATSKWKPLPSVFTAGGDLSGTAISQNVIALKSATTHVNVGSATAPSSGQVLTATGSSAATWQNPQALGAGGVATVVTKTTNYNITTSDYIILCNHSLTMTLTLPAPASGRIFVIKDMSGNAESQPITLARNASEKIEGIAASRLLNTSWGKWTAVSDGVDWFFV